jgi:hypothetical protein
VVVGGHHDKVRELERGPSTTGQGPQWWPISTRP